MSIFDTNTLLLLHCDDFNDSCNNYTITNNGVTISDEGKFGNCFSINQSYITFNKSIELNCNTGFTIDFWINPSRFDAQYQYHLSSGLNFVSYDKNKVYCSMCGINKDAFYVNEPLVLNEFTHIAIVGENNVVKIFINGILKASKDAVNTTQTFDTNNKFFMYQSGLTAHNPVCKIDEFRISNVAKWQTDFEVPVNEYEIVTLEKLSNESSLIDVNERNELLVEGLYNLKDRLENNLNSIGVTDLDNNSMLSLVNRVGNLTVGDLGGRKWASGNFGNITHTHISGNGYNYNTHSIVSNLDFTPSKVFLLISNLRINNTNKNYKFILGSDFHLGVENYHEYMYSNSEYSTSRFYLEIVSNGFNFCSYINNTNPSTIYGHSWIAFE